MSRKLLLASLLIIFIKSLYSQSITLPLERTQRIEQERKLILEGTQWHPVYPFRSDTFYYSAYNDISNKKSSRTKGDFKELLKSKLFFESLIKVDTAGLKLIIDPMVFFSIGHESFMGKGGLTGESGNIQKPDERNTWVNTRGIRVEGSIGNKVSFHSAFYESQAVLTTWADQQSNDLRVVPGQAMYKRFKGTGFDYAFAEGHVSYSPSGYFNFRLGHGKNFLGDGYRSLLLSDVAFNYPYFAINTRVWNIEYVNIFSQLMDISQPKGSWDPWPKKYTTTHYLSWNVTHWLNIGLFESIVWHAGDSTGKRGFELQYLNPIIFYRPVEFSMGSPDNALMGGSIRLKFLKHNMLYFQMLLDEFKLEHVLKGDGWWANKHGFQAGIKSYDFFNIPNLYVQAEYNHVRPYTYSHNSAIQNYGHYNQPLAHPQGANFREIVVLVDKRIKRWQFGYKLIYSTYGADSAGSNYGHNIYFPYKTFVTEYNNKIGQGVKTNLVQHDLRVGVIVNPATNLTFSSGITFHNRTSEISKEQQMYIWVGLRSDMFNRYYDF